MQDLFGSVRRSLVFRINSEEADESKGGSGFVDRIGSRLRKSGVVFLSKHLNPPPLPDLPSHSTLKSDSGQKIRWRKGELIGCGAYGRVYMGMNQDSGELLAIKQVSIATSNASKEKAQAHIQELEEEVKLLKNLSHPNIVRYLGTAREDESLNILLEFVPGGSISSLLGKFGSFPEAVVRNYTKQLLQGLEYLHRNGIMHRDIKGANILVDNKGCIKVADFGASKKVVELATVSGAKSMRGTPYWMAPEVILQTGHSFSADIWSVGCTVIEMVTGKPPWSQQYQQEVAALFHIASTKSHPPIPDNLSMEAKDFLLKCLQNYREPSLRPAASDLLEHPFITMEPPDQQPRLPSFTMEQARSSNFKSELYPENFPIIAHRTSCKGMNDSPNVDSIRPLNLLASDDMCQIGDDDWFKASQSVRPSDAALLDQFNKSFNPMSESLDGWPCAFDERPEQRGMSSEDLRGSVNGDAGVSAAFDKREKRFTFPCSVAGEEDDEVTECKIKAFLDGKALELKKLQSPLYEEFYNTMHPAAPDDLGNNGSDDVKATRTLPPRSLSSVTNKNSQPVDVVNVTSPDSCKRRFSSINGHIDNQVLREIPLPQLNEWKGLVKADQKEPNNPSPSCSERHRKWKEELDQELAREREMKRQTGNGGRLDRVSSRKRGHLWLASPGK